MRRALAAVGVSVAVALAACAPPTTTELTAGVLDEAGMEVDSTWVLVSGEVDGTPLGLVDDRPITLVRTPEGIRGQSSCNGYASAPVADATPDATSSGRPFADVANSAMACPDQAVMELEAQYLSALRQTTDVDVNGATLRLAGAESVLVFNHRGTSGMGTATPLPTASTRSPDVTAAEPESSSVALPPRSTWILESGTVDGEPLRLLDDRPIRLFHDHGTITGQSSCNGYGGEVASDLGVDDPLFTAVEFELAACPSGDDYSIDNPITTLEEGFEMALYATTSVDVSGEVMRLLGPGTELVFHSATAGRELDGDATATGGTRSNSTSAPSPADDTEAPETAPGPTTDPTRDAGEADTSSDALFAGTVFLWRTGGIAGLDESVTIRGDGRFDVTSEDVGSVYQLDRARLQSVAAALAAFDWDGLAARARTDTTADDAITWHVARFDRVLDITDTQLPDPPPALLLEAASLMDEFAPEA